MFYSFNQIKTKYILGINYGGSKCKNYTEEEDR